MRFAFLSSVVLAATLVSAGSDNPLGFDPMISRTGARNTVPDLNVNVDLGVNINVDPDTRTVNVVNYDPAATNREGIDLRIVSRSHVASDPSPSIETDTRVNNIRTGEELVHTSMSMPLPMIPMMSSVTVRDLSSRGGGAVTTVSPITTLPVTQPGTQPGTRPAALGGCPAGERICITDNGTGACYNPNTQTCSNRMVCPLSNPNRCGNECYATDKYVCHTDFLCPAGTPDLALLDGKKACYSSARYNFDGRNLVERR